MTQSTLRFIVFLVGLSGLRLIEVFKPHHPPAVSLPSRWFTNLGLGILNGGIVSLSCAACFTLAASRPLPFAVLQCVYLPPLLRLLTEVVILDIFTYLLHRSYHTMPFLWRLHSVHHTDLDLDVSSASRFHPGEVVLSAFIKVTIVLVLGISPKGLVLFETIMLMSAQFQHSNISLPEAFERWMWRIVVPPEMHRIHHTPTLQDTNSNYGTILTLWDRLFGTLNARKRATSEAFGVAELTGMSQGLPNLLILPFRQRISDETKNAA